MCDTIKIERPLFCRRLEDRGGRSRRDSLGNPIRVKTRAADASDRLEWLELAAIAAPAAAVNPD